MSRLIHFGCSFAVGNGIPHFIPGLPGDVAPHIHKKLLKERKEILEKYNFEPKDPITCGKYLADKLNLHYKKIAQNGASNEMIFRKLLKTELNNSFVLVGFTSYNRREGLTTRSRKTHWHTWKMISPEQEPGYKDLVFTPWKDEYTPAIEEEMQIRTVMQIIYMQNYLKNNNFDFILFGTLVTHYKWIKWLTNTAKRCQPNATVIVGNSVSSSIPELFLQKTNADVVIIGEGEISAYETVEAIRLNKPLDNVPGISFRKKDGEIKVNDLRKVGNINDFSVINWDFFDVERYLAKPSAKADREKDVTRAMPVITARGCAFKCTFCHYVFWNDPYRNRAPNSVIGLSLIHI